MHLPPQNCLKLWLYDTAVLPDIVYSLVGFFGEEVLAQLFLPLGCFYSDRFENTVPRFSSCNLFSCDLKGGNFLSSLLFLSSFVIYSV